MHIKQMKRLYKKRYPKTSKKLEKNWMIKMIGDETDFILSLPSFINPKALGVLGKEEYAIHGEKVSEGLWKIMKKVRRITQLEKK